MGGFLIFNVMAGFILTEEYKFFLIVTGVLAVLGSFLANFVGLRQKVIWAFFIAIYVFDLLQRLLHTYTGITLGPYSFFASFFFGIVCAFYAQSSGSQSRY